MKDVNIKVNIDTGGADSEINKLENSLDGLGSASSSATSKVDKLDDTIKGSKSGMDNLSNSAKKATSAETQMGNAAASASTKVGKLANTTGQANNAVIELGRIASDAEYGLRGMGNNISQLATQIFQLMSSQTQATAATEKNTVATSTNAITTKTAAKASKGASAAIVGQTAVTAVATKTTLGFVGAMKAIGGVLMGPLGVLFLIQGAIAGITAWANSSDEAAESTDGLAESFGTLASKLKDLGLTETQQAMRIEGYINLSKLRASMDAQKAKDDERLIETGKRLIEIEEEKAKKLALINNAAEEQTKVKFQKDYNALLLEENAIKTEQKRIAFLAVESENKYAEAKDRVLLASSNTLSGLNREKAALITVQKNVSTTADQYDEYADKIQKVQDKIDAIQGKKGKEKSIKGTRERDLAAIDAEINAHLDKHKTLQKAEIDASNRKYDKLAEDAKKYGYKTEEIERARIHAITEITEEYSLLENEKQIERNQRKNDLALNQQQWEDDNIEDPYEKYLAQAETIELEMEQLENRYITEQELYKDDKDKLLELEADYLDSSQALKQEAADLAIKRAKELAAKELEVQTNYEEAVVELRDASFDAASEGFALLRTLSGENKKLQAIAIVGENAVAVTKTIVDTISANKILSTTATSETAKAIASAASYDYAGAALHTTAAATATTGIVTNNIEAGSAIAASVGAAASGLAALGESGNLTSGSAPTDSGGGQTPPTFNLVQGSEGNQIQTSIQNAGDTPVRAYVVAQDVTSQQSLDRQIEENSGI